MGKGKGKGRRPQARHKRKLGRSQFDKRGRLDRPNPLRRKTERAKVPLIGALAAVASSMASMLDARMGFRLTIVMAGMLLADDRRVAAAWFAAAGVRDDWDRFYDCLISVGRRTESLALPLLSAVVSKLDPGPDGRLRLAGDDSPTRRAGPHVEGAGRPPLRGGARHDPTPGPADGEWLYGHNWVCLSLLAKHALWGVIALPLRSLLYVRAVNCPALKQKYGWEFRTKQQVRNVWSNIGCWHLNQWMYTMVELCAWDAAKAELTDRSDRPWDNPERRPSHADRRRAISRKMLEKQFLAHLPPTLDTRKMRRLIRDIIGLAA